jgi:hypothetical protein
MLESKIKYINSGFNLYHIEFENDTLMELDEVIQNAGVAKEY